MKSDDDFERKRWVRLLRRFFATNLGTRIMAWLDRKFAAMEARDDERYVAKRTWWFPFVVGVWDKRWAAGDHWKRGHYYTWFRIGTFATRSKAEQFIEAKKKNSELTA